MKQAEAFVTAWFAENLADRVGRASPAAIEQVNTAIKKLPEAIEQADGDAEDALEPWFAEHFHRPPVSHDTELYNAIHAALNDLRVRLVIDSTTHDD
jgi:hypothetical protein